MKYSTVGLVGAYMGIKSSTADAGHGYMGGGGGGGGGMGGAAAPQS